MKFLDIGRVIGLHGVRGKVKVAAFSGDPEGVLAAKRTCASPEARDGAGGGRKLRGGDGAARGRLRRFRFVGDRHHRGGGTVGEGGRLRAAKNPSLPEDEFYWVDAVGCLVVDEAGLPLGEVVAVEPGAAYDYLVVRRPGRKHTSPWWRLSFARSTRRRGG